MKAPHTGLCAQNSPVTSEFPVQGASDAEMFSFDDVIMTFHDMSPSLVKYVIWRSDNQIWTPYINETGFKLLAPGYLNFILKM